MKLLRGTQFLPQLATGTAVTIGNFDGVHLGHQALLRRLKEIAHTLRLPTVVILFEPQPAEYFLKDKAPSRVSSLREKLDALAACGIDFVYCLKFDSALSAMDAETFARSVLFNLLNSKYILIGQDFRFGYQRSGDSNLLHQLARAHHVKVELFDNFLLHDLRISSTKIRQALQANDLDEAQTLLGRPYSVCGRIVKGAQRGRQWGIPTANVHLRKRNIPLNGVFCVRVKWSNSYYNGVANLGLRPTVDGTKFVFEVHLLNMQENFYDQFIHVFFLRKLRDEIKFNTVDELIAQIKDDINRAKYFFANNLASIE